MGRMNLLRHFVGLLKEQKIRSKMQKIVVKSNINIHWSEGYAF